MNDQEVKDLARGSPGPSIWLERLNSIVKNAKSGYLAASLRFRYHEYMPVIYWYGTLSGIHVIQT